MAKLAQLQQLIQSLSKAEKRHFRLASNRSGGDKTYLQLFDYYLRHPSADLRALKQKFNGHAHQQLSVHNDYLYQRLLATLKSLHQHSSIDFQIRENIQQAEVLFDRELILQAQGALDRAEKLANKFQRHALLSDIYNLQRKILLTKDGPLKAAQALNDWGDKQRVLIDDLDGNRKLWQALFELGQGKSVSDKTLTRLPKQTNGNLQADILRLHIRFADSIVKNRLEQGLQAIGRLIALLEQHPLLIEDDPNGYVTTINNKISILLFKDDQNEIGELFQRLHQLHQRYRIRRVNPSLNRQLLRSYNIELEYHREQFNIEHGCHLIPLVNAFAEKNKLIVPDDYRLMLYYQFAFFTFVAAEFKQATQWLNKLNRVTPSQLRPEVRIQGKLLNLCLLYQFNQLSALKYAVDNTRRFMHKHQLTTENNATVLKIFSRLCLQGVAQQSLLLQSRDQLKQLAQNPDIRGYIHWLEQYNRRLMQP